MEKLQKIKEKILQREELIQREKLCCLQSYEETLGSPLHNECQRVDMPLTEGEYLWTFYTQHKRVVKSE